MKTTPIPHPHKSRPCRHRHFTEAASSGLALRFVSTALLMLCAVALPLRAQTIIDIKPANPGSIIPIASVELDDNGTIDLQTSRTPATDVGLDLGVRHRRNTPVNLRSVTVTDGGATAKLKHVNKLTDVKLQGFASSSVSGGNGVGVLYPDGTTVKLGSSAAMKSAYRIALRDAMESLDLNNYAFYDHIDKPASSMPPANTPDFDLLYVYGLTVNDYLLVMERWGNTFFKITPLDKDGNPVAGANILRFGHPSGPAYSLYDWNTGYANSVYQKGQAYAFTVAKVSKFFEGTAVPASQRIVYGFRIDNDGEADVKFFGFSPDPFENNPVLPAGIGNRVWNDLDRNGVQNEGEPGINGVSVRLLNADGTPYLDSFGSEVVTTTVNDTSGNPGYYAFGGLPAASYRVEFTLPSGYAFTSADADGMGLHGPDNSDADPATGLTPVLILNENEVNFHVDAGLFRLGAITGTVTEDTTGDHAGDMPMPGVAISLLDPLGEVLSTTVTGADGTYGFDDLMPGGYTVGETDPDGYHSLTPNSLTAAVTAGGVAVADFEDARLTTISGHVFVKNTPLAGVTITLIDRFGDPVDGDPETEGIQPITTVTASNGYYVFHNVPADTYMVGQTRPQGYLSFGDADGGDPDLIGDVTPIGTLPGEHSENNDFILMLDGCPDNWTEWKLQHPGETAGGNPDADAYDNFAEFAFAMPYNQGTGSEWLGSTAWVIQPSTIAPGTIEAVFVRPEGAPENATYSLQYAAALGNPTVWQEIILTPESPVTTVDNGDCTETVTIHDLETLTGLTGGEGFVRIRVNLDDDGGQDQIDHTSFTEVEGWTVTDLDICCRTYNVPYQRETAFTGTISDVNAQVLTFADADSLDTLLGSGGSCYVEVTSGQNEGLRFDIVSVSGNTITVAENAGLPTAAFITMAAATPSSLVGNTVSLRRHWTLDEVFPPSGFGASNTMKTADEVQIFVDGAWSLYWLYSNGGSPMWIKAGADSTINQGVTVIPPGQGMFFHNRHTETSILSYGEVRTNDFVRPLAAGNNLVGGGYPIAQSANGTGGRAMNIATGFFANRDFKTADSIHIWKADTRINAPGYDGYYLVDATAVVAGVLRWVKVGDPSLADRDSEVILHGNRAAFIRSSAGIGQYTSPSPWTP